MTDSATAENRIRLMSLAYRYPGWLSRLAFFLPVISIITVTGLGLSWIGLPEVLPQDGVDGGGSLSIPTSSGEDAVAPGGWIIFENHAPSAPSEGGHLSKRFRLAGTFFVSGPGGEDTRRAVLADAQGGEQLIVSENELVKEVLVVRIHRDSVILRGPSGEEELWLTFATQSEKGHGGGMEGTGGKTEESVGFDRFGGKQVGERNWVFRRESVMGYYRDLMEDPERLVKVFDSLKPVYVADGKIDGYRVGIEGEREFFQAVGLKENDVVRSVNSLPMTNRNRAEYFIREFVGERASAFVLEVERGGSVAKFVYQVR